MPGGPAAPARRARPPPTAGRRSPGWPAGGATPSRAATAGPRGEAPASRGESPPLPPTGARRRAGGPRPGRRRPAAPPRARPGASRTARFARGGPTRTGSGSQREPRPDLRERLPGGALLPRDPLGRRRLESVLDLEERRLLLGRSPAGSQDQVAQGLCLRLAVNLDPGGHRLADAVLRPLLQARQQQDATPV